MWLVRSVLVFTAVAAVTIFAIGNGEYRTSLRLLTRTYVDQPLNVVLLCAAIFGALVTFVTMVFREFALRANIRRLRRENLRLDDELTALRNLPISSLETTQQRESPSAES